MKGILRRTEVDSGLQVVLLDKALPFIEIGERAVSTKGDLALFTLSGPAFEGAGVAAFVTIVAAIRRL